MSRRILLIDDEQTTVDSIELILSQEGYTVQSSLTAKDIFTQIKEFKPDLMLLDIVLQEDDGRDICRAIKNDPTTEDIPVIIISGHDHVFKTIIDHCANDVLFKPFKIDALLTRIERQLKQATHIRELYTSQSKVQPE